MFYVYSYMRYWVFGVDSVGMWRLVDRRVPTNDHPFPSTATGSGREGGCESADPEGRRYNRHKTLRYAQGDRDFISLPHYQLLYLLL